MSGKNSSSHPCLITVGLLFVIEHCSIRFIPLFGVCITRKYSLIELLEIAISPAGEERLKYDE